MTYSNTIMTKRRVRTELIMRGQRRSSSQPVQGANGANQLLTKSLVGTPHCGVRSAQQRADPTKN
jgi:hypothetical protein